MNKALFKYEGPVLNGNNKVRMEHFKDYVWAVSGEQALMLLTRRYKQRFRLSEKAYVILKEKYLKEVKSNDSI